MNSTLAPVSEESWTDTLARLKPQLQGTVNVKTATPRYLVQVLQLWVKMGEDRLHLFVSWGTVRVAALYANQELTEQLRQKLRRSANLPRSLLRQSRHVPGRSRVVFPPTCTKTSTGRQ
ncbi:hypothetical protein MTO96_006343 [Rhipicephalus appendiculatus]